MKPEVSLTCTQGTQKMPVMSHANPISSAFAKLAKATLEFRHVCPSVRPPAWNNSSPTGRIYLKFDIEGFK
jgi:hypothetical protein